MPWGPRPLSPITRPVAGVLALTLAASAGAAAAAPGQTLSLRTRAAPETPESEIERLYVEGQEKYGNGDFAAAASAWTRLLNRLSEAQANKATRENVLLNILQADIDAYNRTRLDNGSKDIEHLRSGKKTLDEYYTSYRRAYGDLAAVSAAVQEKGDELESLKEQAEAEAAADDPIPPDDGGEDGDDDDGGGDEADGGDDGGGGIVEPPRQRDDAGGGLIIGGAVSTSVGVGMLGLGIAGAVLGPRAEDDFNNATDADEEDAATDRGSRANAIMISGLALSAVGLGLGAALIVLGIKKRGRGGAIGVAPAIGPRFSGATLTGRF